MKNLQTLSAAEGEHDVSVSVCVDVNVDDVVVDDAVMVVVNQYSKNLASLSLSWSVSSLVESISSSCSSSLKEN